MKQGSGVQRKRSTANQHHGALLPSSKFALCFSSPAAPSPVRHTPHLRPKLQLRKVVTSSKEPPLRERQRIN